MKTLGWHLPVEADLLLLGRRTGTDRSRALKLRTSD